MAWVVDKRNRAPNPFGRSRYILNAGYTMTTIPRFLFATAFVFLAISHLAGTQATADLVYAIENHASDQNGHTVSGLITTTDAAINDGWLLASEVLSWEFATSGPTSTSISSTDASALLQISGDVMISATSINLEQPLVMSGFLNRIEMSHSDGSRLIWHRDEFFGEFTDIYQSFSQNNGAWTNNSPIMSGTDPWLVATRVSSVPEPTSIAMFGSVAGLGLIRRRRRRH
jgi:hypothetical protein